MASGVTLQGDGKIVVAGNATRDPGEHFALARYNPNGSLDTSFSGDGKQTTDFGGFGQDGATGVALQGNGKIVAVGSTGRHPSSDFALARYNPDGSLDTSFSGDGRQTTDFGGLDTATGVALQGDGKIVVVGRGDARDFALARYNPDGSLDTSFSGDGKQTTDFFGGIDEATGVALQGDGKMVVVGRARRRDFALARYNPNGSLDTSFSGDGKQTTDFFGNSDGATGRSAPGRRQDCRSGQHERDRRRRLRARPLQPQWIARHELLRGRQADDGLPRELRRGDRSGAPGQR